MTKTLIKPSRPAMQFPEIYIPGAVVPTDRQMGQFLVNLSKLGIFPSIEGAATGQGGYNAAGDLLTQTVDGFDLNSIWGEFQRALGLVNEQRTTLVRMLTFPVTNNIERVPSVTTGDFERASEYGEPRGLRPSGQYLTMGYGFYDYDLAARFTWKFLRDSPAAQVEAINVMAIEADNRLIYNKVMGQLFSPANQLADINGQEVNVYALYNADGTVPPTYKTNTFNGSHTHYLVSGGATVVSGDLDDMYEHLRHHGYSMENGVNHVLLVNPIQANVIRTFRVANGDAWDFIPSQGTPPFLLPTDVRIVGGGQAPSTISGIRVLGTYGEWTILVDDMFPAGYMVGIGTGGEENLRNPVGFREHDNPSFRGLRLVKGPDPNYPLIDSFYQRSFGTGIRHRGGSVIMQIKASGSYDTPTFV